MDDIPDDTGSVVLTAGQAAERLGLGPGMLRRYSDAWETVKGEKVPRDSRGGRIYPGEMMEALERARELVKATPGMSAETAIRVASGLEPEPIPLARAGTDDAAATMIAALFEQVAALTQEVGSLRGQLALPPADRQAEIRNAVRAELGEWEAAQDPREAVALAIAPLRQQMDELTDQNRLLLEALVEAQRREAHEVLAARMTPRKGLLARLLRR